MNPLSHYLCFCAVVLALLAAPPIMIYLALAGAFGLIVLQSRPPAV